MREAKTGSSSVTNHQRTRDKMSDYEDSNISIALPPTPGRTLNILTTTAAAATAKRENNSNKAKRRLELDAESAAKDQEQQHTIKRKDKFTIPKKSKSTAAEEKAKHKQSHHPQPPPTHLKKPKTEPTTISTGAKSEEASKKSTPLEERLIAKRLKTLAWSRILRHKQKLYIPHTSDPRMTSQEEDETVASQIKEEKIEENVKPLVEDKEISCSISMNVSIFTTPVKMSDHNSIIKFMSITTPQLLSPLSENPLK